MTMTLIPIAGLIVAYIVFSKKFTLSDERVKEISTELKARKSAATND